MKANRVISMLLAFALVVSLTTTTATANSIVVSDDKREMDVLDLLLVSHRYMSGTTDNTYMWDDDVSIKDIVPLYDIDDNIMAYYIAFENNGYAIINNNLNNPIPIEFGEGDNTSIRTILDEAATSEKPESPKICYVNPFFTYDKNQNVNMLSEINKEEFREKHHLDKFYTMLKSVNEDEKALHEKSRKLALASMNRLMSGSYDFIDWNSMPSGSYSADWLPFSGTTWAVMSNYTGKTNPISKKVIDDHCGATAATNICLYFATQGYTRLKKNGSVNDTFYDLHSRTGNGPVLTIAGDVKSYATSRGTTIRSSSVASYSTYKTAISKDRPCGILLTAAPKKWHWVVGVGYRDYASGSKYVRIVTGWKNSANFFYLWGNPGTWSITQYWIP